MKFDKFSCKLIKNVQLMVSKEVCVIGIEMQCKIAIQAVVCLLFIIVFYKLLSCRL
jgi:hypothetical protein